MSRQAKKYYTVWIGRHPGVYDDWSDAQEQIDNFPGAKFKSFTSAEEASEAFRKGIGHQTAGEIGSLLSRASGRRASASGHSPSKETGMPLDFSRFPEIDPLAWAVDASCMGNPGTMEYRGVEVATGKEIFRVGPFKKATNNIGEFLAIVHALALQQQKGLRIPIYSDSVSGMSWVRKRHANTRLNPTPDNEPVRTLISRAERWLLTHSVHTPILKWNTELWGEIPADFGRK